MSRKTRTSDYLPSPSFVASGDHEPPGAPGRASMGESHMTHGSGHRSFQPVTQEPVPTIMETLAAMQKKHRMEPGLATPPTEGPTA